MIADPKIKCLQDPEHSELLEGSTLLPFLNRTSVFVTEVAIRTVASVFKRLEIQRSEYLKAPNKQIEKSIGRTKRSECEKEGPGEFKSK